MPVSERTNPAGMNPKSLPPSLMHGLRALAVAGEDFEPFVDWIVSSAIIGRLVELGLAEPGESCRPAVGTVGYRLTERGRSYAEILWGYSPKPKILQPA